jgi:hypothetical protein
MLLSANMAIGIFICAVPPGKMIFMLQLILSWCLRHVEDIAISCMVGVGRGVAA